MDKTEWSGSAKVSGNRADFSARSDNFHSALPFRIFPWIFHYETWLVGRFQGRARPWIFLDFAERPIDWKSKWKKWKNIQSNPKSIGSLFSRFTVRYCEQFTVLKMPLSSSSCLLRSSRDMQIIGLKLSMKWHVKRKGPRASFFLNFTPRWVTYLGTFHPLMNKIA